MALSFQKKIMLQTHLGVVLCRSADEKGTQFFHFLLVDASAFRHLQRAYTANSVIDFGSYGKIIHSGWGEPTEEDQEIANQLANAA